MRHFNYGLFKLILVASLGFIAMTGCASFLAGDLQDYSYEDVTPVKKLPAIDYEAKWFVNNNNNIIESPPTGEIFKEEINKVFERSGVFSGFKAGNGTEKYHLNLEMTNIVDLDKAKVLGFISGITFCLIPIFVTDEYVMKAEVMKDGVLIKEYKYENSLVTWFHILMVFLTPFKPPAKTARELMDETLLNFLHDLVEDQALLP